MRHLFLAVLLGVLFSYSAYTQCSDAGACAIGGHEAEAMEHRPLRIGISSTHGSSGKTDDLRYNSIIADVTWRVDEHGMFMLRLPWTRGSGPLGDAQGLGDVLVIAERTVWSTPTLEFRAQVGGKFATGVSNANDLPQAYQPGLGSNDVLLGIAVSINEWNMSIGYQHPFGRSDNAITRLKRGSDVVLRAGYSTDIDAVGVSGELLAVKRLSESSVLVLPSGGSEQFTDVPGSDQFQLNVLLTATYTVSADVSLGVQAAAPLLAREVNVDGLTRSFTVGIGLAYSPAL